MKEVNTVSKGPEIDPMLAHDYMLAFQLDPVPTRERDDYRDMDAGSFLHVEDYRWGRVCTAHHTGWPGWVTWVEHGSVPSLTPSWALDLRVRYDSPECFTQHADGDAACDGAPSAIGRPAQPPCVFRDVCRMCRLSPAVRERMNQTDIVDEQPPERQVKLGPVPVPERKVKNAKKPKKNNPAGKKRDQKAKRDRKRKKMDPYVRQRSMELAVEFMEGVSDAIEREWFGDQQFRSREGTTYYLTPTKANPRRMRMFLRQLGARAEPRVIVYCDLGTRQPWVTVLLMTQERRPRLGEYLREHLPDTIRVNEVIDNTKGLLNVKLFELTKTDFPVVLARIREAHERRLWGRVRLEDERV